MLSKIWKEFIVIGQGRLLLYYSLRECCKTINIHILYALQFKKSVILTTKIQSSVVVGKILLTQHYVTRTLVITSCGFVQL